MKLDFQAWLRAREEGVVAQDDDAIGDAVFAQIDDVAVVENTGWAPELWERVSVRIQADDPVEPRKIPVVFWSSKRTAFTLPGRRIFVSRSLLEEQMPEDAVAFVFAHELAHHRLGHLQTVLPALRSTGHRLGARALTFAVMMASRLVSSRHNEAAADEWALARCVRAGYDGPECLKIFDVLARIGEDWFDLEGVFGHGHAEEQAAQTLERDEQPPWQRAASDFATRAGRAAWEISRGYPSIRDRRERLEAVLARGPAE